MKFPDTRRRSRIRRNNTCDTVLAKKKTEPERRKKGRHVDGDVTRGLWVFILPLPKSQVGYQVQQKKKKKKKGKRKNIDMVEQCFPWEQGGWKWRTEPKPQTHQWLLSIQTWREREGMNGFNFLLSFTTQIRPEHLKLLVRYVSWLLHVGHFVSVR